MVFHFRHEFEVSYQLDIHNICSDFQEDLQFHFSLGWRTILRKFVAPYNRRLAIVLGADVCWWSLSNTLTECCGTFSVRCTSHMTYYQHHGLMTLSSLLSHDLTLLQLHELDTRSHHMTSSSLWKSALWSHYFIITMLTWLHHHYGHMNSALWSHDFIITMLTWLYHHYHYGHMNSTLWSHDLNI
jgi:hypothetical protein